MRAAVPELAAAMAGQWGAGYVDMWQRDATQPGGWARQRSERGVWQGSRLAQVAFGVALVAALRDAWAATIPAPPGSPPGAIMGIADDQYVLGDVRQVVDFLGHAQSTLGEQGQLLKGPQCVWWAPASAPHLGSQDTEGPAPSWSSMESPGRRTVSPCSAPQRTAAAEPGQAPASTTPLPRWRSERKPRASSPRRRPASPRPASSPRHPDGVDGLAALRCHCPRL